MAYFTEARICNLGDGHLIFRSCEGGTSVGGNVSVKRYIYIENLKEEYESCTLIPPTRSYLFIKKNTRNTLCRIIKFKWYRKAQKKEGRLLYFGQSLWIEAISSYDFFFLRKCFKEMSHYRFACSFFNQYILELFPYVLAHVDVLYYFRWTHNHHDD